MGSMLPYIAAPWILWDTIHRYNIYIYIYYTVKNKVRMRFWLRVMVARLTPPHGSRILTEGSRRIACKYAATQLECGRKIGEKMYVLTGMLQAKWS